MLYPIKYKPNGMTGCQTSEVGTLTAESPIGRKKDFPAQKYPNWWRIELLKE